jgi:hypothetical protein
VTDPLLEVALDRTFLLMRDNLAPEVSNAQLLHALTSTKVALVASEEDLQTHAAQSAYVTAALQMARSGHRIALVAPDVRLIGSQPPLIGTNLISSLFDVGRDLLPGIEFSAGMPEGRVDLTVHFGKGEYEPPSAQSLYLNATPWAAHLSAEPFALLWPADNWPVGAIAAGALAATEAFKHAMRGLNGFANDETFFRDLFAPVACLAFRVAPESTPQIAPLGNFDMVSAGAITQAALYALLRLPGVSGGGRVIDPEATELSNLNRYALLRRSTVDKSKPHLLQRLAECALALVPVEARFEGSALALHSRVVVGVDDIPVRWRVQEAQPQWLGIGATTHWCAMASHHQSGVACARCLHPRDDADQGPIPTAPFVSLLAGLFLASYLVRSTPGESAPEAEQHVYFTPLRPERVWRTPVSLRPGCPTCARLKCAASSRAE